MVEADFWLDTPEGNLMNSFYKDIRRVSWLESLLVTLVAKRRFKSQTSTVTWSGKFYRVSFGPYILMKHNITGEFSVFKARKMTSEECKGTVLDILNRAKGARK